MAETEKSGTENVLKTTRNISDTVRETRETDRDAADLWERAIEQIRSSLPESEYSAWFSRLRFAGERNGSLVLWVPSAFFNDKFQTKYKVLVEKTLKELGGSTCSVVFEIRKESDPVSTAESSVKTASTGARHGSAQEQAEGQKQEPHRDRRISTESTLNPAYTFDSFVPGENSSFAYSAAVAIARNPGSVYNPFLLYGGVGLGKTHLLQSIGNHIQQTTKLKVMYVTAENFTNEFMEALAEHKTRQFQNRYRKVNVLLMDDIQFLQKKEGTQNELFNTFNDLYETNRQIVFTSDRPIEQLRDISERLKSRFSRGLIVDIQPPDYETRMAILKTKCVEKDFIISQDVLDYIALNISNNVRALESCITKLIAYSTLLNKDVSLEIAKEQLKQIINTYNDSSEISINFIIKTVAAYFNISPSDIKGKGKNHSLVLPRQISMYLCRELTDFSTTEIAAEFGGKNHTTVMYNVQKVESMIRSSQKDVAQTVLKLSNQIKQETRSNQ